MKRGFSTVAVTKPVKHRKQSTAAELMSDWQNKGVEATTTKNQLLVQKGEREEKWEEAELKLSEEKFSFEKECRLKEFELRKMEIEKDERIAKLQLEKEERIERLKMKLNFKLQLELANNGKA